MMRDLGIAWVIRREMEVRARRPSWYEGFAYEGLTLPSIYLALPLGVGVLRADGCGEGFVWFMIPYALYLFYAAAGMASGGLAVDRECLRRLPVSAGTLLVGKLVGSLLNLWLELVMVSPLVLLLACQASAFLGPVVLGFLAWLVLYGGLLGMVWTYDGVPPRVSANQARANASALFFGLPAVFLLLGIVLMNNIRHSDLDSLNWVWLLHPMGGLLLLQAPDLGLVTGVVVCAAVAGLLALRALHRLNSSLP